MGKAIVISGADWALRNLGQVTPLLGLSIEGQSTISGASVYSARYNGNQVSVSWSVSGNATISGSSGATVTLTPLEDGAVTLTASYTHSGTTYTATKNIGVILPHLEILPSVDIITSATLFTAYYDSDVVTDAVFSISNMSLATLTDNGNGTCTVTPLVDGNMDSVTLSATSASHGSASVSFVPQVNLLPEGHTRMLYVQGHGYPYIDTGVTPTSNTRVVIDFQYIHTSPNSSYSYLLDVETTHEIAVNISANKILFSGLTTAHTYKDWRRHTIDVSQQRLIFDGTEYANTEENPSAWTATHNLWLFGGKASVVVRPSASRIYSCKVYEGDTLIRDYVPDLMSDGSVFGLYDLVGSQFYAPERGELFGQRTEPAYITDGLIAKFDGYDASTSYWADAYNSLFGISLPSGTTKTADEMGVIFDGSGVSSASNPPTYNASAAELNSGTIEVVYKVDSMPSAAMYIVKGYTAKSGSHGKFVFYIGADGYVRNDIYVAQAVNNSISGYIGRTVTQSVNATLNYVNGISLGKGEVAEAVSSPGATSAPSINGYKVSSTAYGAFTGTIYQVRIYNRELTAAEIQHNQAIDIQRYGINNQ